MAISHKPFTLILALIVAGTGWWMLTGVWQARQPALQHALQLPEPRTLPEFQLLDQQGIALTNDWFRGRWTLVFFGFTHCPDICPATLQILSAARRELQATGRADDLPQILLISVDPERDTVASLQQYIAHFGEGISGATGALEEIRKLASALGIFFEREALEPGDDPRQYNVAHSAHVLLIDDQGMYRAVFSPPHSIAAFVTDLPILMRSNGATAGPALSVSDVQLIAALPGRDAGVAYLTLHNHRNQAVALAGITSPQFARVELHETLLNNGIASMRSVTSLTLEANSSTGLVPGGKHLMLFEPAQALTPGQRVTLQFHFTTADLIVVDTTLKLRLSVE